MSLSEKTLTAFFEAIDDDLGDVSDIPMPREMEIWKLVANRVLDQLEKLVPLCKFDRNSLTITRDEESYGICYMASVKTTNWLDKKPGYVLTFYMRQLDSYMRSYRHAHAYQRVEDTAYAVKGPAGFEMEIHPNDPAEDAGHTTTTGKFDTAVNTANAKARAAQTGATYNDLKAIYKALANAGYTKGAVDKREKLQYVTVKKDIHDELEAFVKKMGWDKLGIQVTGTGFDSYLRIPYVVGEERGNE